MGYLTIIGQILLTDASGAFFPPTAQQPPFFATLLEAFLEGFDAAGGGAIGCLRRCLFVQAMLRCLVASPAGDALEAVLDCAANVLAEEEASEDKLRILFVEKEMSGDRVFSGDYLQRFVAQSRLRESVTEGVRVGMGRNIEGRRWRIAWGEKRWRKCWHRWRRRLWRLWDR